MAEADRLSNLPTEIIHDIMFFLPLLDVIQVSVLSRRFNSVWRTFPVIEFDQDLFATGLKLPINHSKASEMLMRFSDYTDDFLRRRGPDSFLQKFKLRTLRIPDLDRYIEFSLGSHVQELEINSKIILELSEGISDVFAAKSIRVLKLTGLDLGLQNLILGDSSLIEELSLNECDLLETVRVLSDKLLSLELQCCRTLQNIEIDAPNLQYFRYDGGILFSKININLRSFESLKSLSLWNAGGHITNNWFEEKIPKFISLEKLSIKKCENLKKVKICHKRLKIFEFHNYKNKAEEEVEVELELITPNLLSFLYRGILLSHTIVTSTLFEARLFLTQISATSLWFLALRHFLISFDHCKVLTLEFEKVVGFPNELKDRWIAPMFTLKHLRVEVNSNLRSYRNLVALMLQLSPRLNTLSIIQNLNSQDPIERVIKFKYVKGVADQQDDSSCCKRLPIKCWRHHLTSITMENFEDVNDKERLITFFKDNTKISKKQDEKSIISLF